MEQRNENKTELKMIKMSDVQSQTVDWLWYRIFDTPNVQKPCQAYFFASNSFISIAYYRTISYNRNI